MAESTAERRLLRHHLHPARISSRRNPEARAFVPGFLRFMAGGAVGALSLIASSIQSQAQPTGPFLSGDRCVYDGMPHGPGWAGPAGPPVVIGASHRPLVPGEGTDVFSQIPQTINLSYQSWSFSAKKDSMLGNYVHLGGANRVADHVEVVMITWARADDYPEWAAADPTGYTHPITLVLYRLDSVGSSAQPVELDASTVRVHVPWKPTTLPDGSTYRYNGYAFRVLFPLSAKIVLPDDLVVAVAYDTQSSGFHPIGAGGPYNELNVALTGRSPSVGSDPDPDSVFKVTGDSWNYPVKGWRFAGSPMFRIVARESPATGSGLLSQGLPVDSGTYQIRTLFADGTAWDSVYGIDKAAAAILTSDPGKSVLDPDPGPIVETDPPGLPFTLSYAGSSNPPLTPGVHRYEVRVESRNHEGFAEGAIRLSAARYGQWAPSALAGVRPDLASERADPDQDGRPNWLEYAIGGDPLKPDPAILISRGPEGVTFSHKFRNGMDGIAIGIERSVNLVDWTDQPAAEEADGDFWRVFRWSPGETAEPVFYRLKASALEEPAGS